MNNIPESLVRYLMSEEALDPTEVERVPEFPRAHWLDTLIIVSAVLGAVFGLFWIGGFR